MKKLFKLFLLTFILVIGIFFIQNYLTKQSNNTQVVETPTQEIQEDGYYTSKEDVALYIYTYHKLPDNYVTKSQAKKMGWEASKGNLLKVCEGCSIGGDVFSNREKHLPSKKGRTYYECDIDYDGGNRNAKRIVFSDDGLIYYTDDHYNTFELLYGEPNE